MSLGLEDPSQRQYRITPLRSCPPGGASASTLGATARSDRCGGESGRQGFCPVDAAGSVRVGVGPDATACR
jgi:hypothetical protein